MTWSLIRVIGDFLHHSRGQNKNKNIRAHVESTLKLMVVHNVLCTMNSVNKEICSSCFLQLVCMGAAGCMHSGAGPIGFHSKAL